MLDYLRRLATTGAAYTAASILSKILAVALLPLYTRYLDPADYGAAEVLFSAVVVASIVVRLGIIEALLRFFYLPDEDGDEVVRTGFASLFMSATIGALVLLPFAPQLADLLLDDGVENAANLVRISIGGLWVLTLYEYLVSLFRLDERARAYFTFTILHVLAAIPLTVFLVVGEGLGAEGLLLGSYLSGVPFVLWIVVADRERLGLVPDRDLLNRMVKFGLPTMPAEVTLYALQFIDRIIIVRSIGLAEAGLYALAFKFSQAIQVVVRGFQLAWPPLAYSIQDDEEARRTYAVVLTVFSALCMFLVVALWLEAPWIVRLLAAPEFFDSHEAVGPLALGAALYGVYLAQLVILGRTGKTERNLPATAAGMIANVALNLLLVPPYGIVGAGVALVLSYLVVIALMYAFTQSLFPIPWQWGRLAVIAVSAAVVIAAGELLLPTEGALGLISRAVLIALYPVILWWGGAIKSDEREAVRTALASGDLRERLRRMRGGGAAGDVPEGAPGNEDSRAAGFMDAETRDQDRGGF
ncbi:MAG: oligosaccharide flippase family protein [Solirubrobacterales bacterium]|nr:oligosaccharide flippase family protein [Solirubrobacterales bacterium]